MLLHHYPESRLATPSDKIMMTTDIHASCLYITHPLRICWYKPFAWNICRITSLSLKSLNLDSERWNFTYSLKNKNRFPQVSPRWWAESVLQRYMFFFEMQWKYRNKCKTFRIFPLSTIYKSKNPLSTYHHHPETPYSSHLQNGDRLSTTYHLIYHLSPPQQRQCRHTNQSPRANRSINRGQFQFQGRKP